MHYRSLVVRAVAVAAPVLSIAIFACSETTTTTGGGSTSGEPNKDLPNSGIAQNDGNSSSGKPGTSSGSAGTSGGTSGGPTGPTVNLTTYATATGNAFCDFYQRCFPSFITHVYGTVNDCKTRMTQVANGQWKADALFDEAAVNAASACATASACDAKYGAVWQVKCEFPKPVNLQADNAKCNDKDHCQSGHCFGLTETACGTCKPSVTVGLGIACGGDAVCSKGLTCLGKCYQPRGLGETCNSANSQVCGAGLNCNATSGVCEKGGVVNDPCPGGAVCDTFQNATCKSSTDTCVATVFAGLDETCGRFGEGPQCDVGLHCKVPMPDSGIPGDIGVCKPRAADGQPCTFSGDCREFANCRNNICVLAGTDRPTCN
jgi:hypothetical protein